MYLFFLWWLFLPEGACAKPLSQMGPSFCVGLNATWYLSRQLSVFTGVLCHAWKICFESEAHSERRQKYLPTTFWQWSFCEIMLDISAAEQSRISCWAVPWFCKVYGETNSLDPFVKPLVIGLENTYLYIHAHTHIHNL